jgi:hypothetical protein
VFVKGEQLEQALALHVAGILLHLLLLLLHLLEL